jgi:hypothetical protein
LCALASQRARRSGLGLQARVLPVSSIGRRPTEPLIEGPLRADLVVNDELGFAPLDDVGRQLLFRFVAAAYERRSLGIGSHWRRPTLSATLKRSGSHRTSVVVAA